MASSVGQRPRDGAEAPPPEWGGGGETSVNPWEQHFIIPWRPPGKAWGFTVLRSCSREREGGTKMATRFTLVILLREGAGGSPGGGAAGVERVVGGSGGRAGAAGGRALRVLSARVQEVGVLSCDISRWVEGQLLLLQELDLLQFLLKLLVLELPLLTSALGRETHNPASAAQRPARKRAGQGRLLRRRKRGH